MSASVSWSDSYQIYTDNAIMTIHNCVSVMRARGFTIANSYSKLAYALKVTPRRVRTLLNQDGAVVVKRTEWEKLRKSAGTFFLEEAERLRRLAETYETIGEKMMSDDEISELTAVGEKMRATTHSHAGLCV